jgi:16S rRNA processing protein RimM
VPAGRVGRPHGLDGSFHVLRPGARALALGGTVTVAGRDYEIERLAGTSERPIVRLSGCSSRSDAEALAGSDLMVPDALEDGEYWASDLVGCTVVDGSREVGVVARMVALPSCEALEVGAVLIPLVRDAIRSIDVDARRIDVDMEFVGE